MTLTELKTLFASSGITWTRDPDYPRLARSRPLTNNDLSFLQQKILSQLPELTIHLDDRNHVFARVQIE